jgi:hypothetical protein
MKTTPLFAAALLWSALSARADDTFAPELVSISVTPVSVDVTSGSQTIDVTLVATDDDTGLLFGNIFLVDPLGRQVDGYYFDGDERTGGDGLDGTYQISAEIPQYAEPGTWKVGVLLIDVADNSRRYSDNDESFPTPGDEEVQVDNTGDVDSEEPFLLSFDVTPTEVDTSGAAAEISVTVECGDALSGVIDGFVQVRDPSGVERYDLWEYFSDFHRVAGDALSGTYEVTVTLPQGSAVGVWELDVQIQDMVGNFTSATGTTVMVGEGAPLANDLIAQAVDAVQLAFVTSGGGWVYQTNDSFDSVDAAASLPIGDDGQCVMTTTVTGPGTLDFQWMVDSETEADFLSVELDGNEEDSISGQLGWMPASLAIPPGTHTVTWRYAKDVSIAVGADRGWVDQVRFTGDSDLELPRVQDLRISPRRVDISGGSQDVYVNIEVTDDFNGLSEGLVEVFDPLGNPVTDVTFGEFERVEGDGMAGTYEVFFTIDGIADPGEWRVAVRLTEDTTFNQVTYGQDDEALPVPDSDRFLVNDGTLPDNEAPRLRILSVTPNPVDVSGGPATALVTLRITDDVSGLNDGNVGILTPTGSWTGSSYFSEFWRISGDELDGIYQVEIDVPQYAAPGTWSLSCFLMDGEGNNREYPFNTDFEASVIPTFTVTNSGTVDDEAPLVTSLDVTPEQIDTTAAPAEVEVTVSIQENLSGLRDAYVYFFNPSNVYQGSLFTVLDASNRISGNAGNGTYQITREIPQGSPEGEWTVRIFTRDLAGNFRIYGNAGVYDPLIGEGFFTVGGAAASLFEAFVSLHSLTGEDALPGADPDRDGRNNATELMQGTDPNDPADAGPFTLARDATHLHLDFTIDSALTVAVDGLYLELSDGGGGAPLRLTGQTQPGLTGAWTPVLPLHQGGNTWRISLPFSGGPQGFMRLFFGNP